MYCAQCGAKLKEGVKFCAQCGSVVNGKEAAIHYEGSDSWNTVQNTKNVTVTKYENLDETTANGEEVFIPDNSADVEKPIKKKGLLVVVVIILVLLIIGTSGAAFWVYGGKDMIMNILGVTELPL